MARPALTETEKRGMKLYHTVVRHIKAASGLYLKAQDGSLYLVLGRRRIKLDLNQHNINLATLLLDVCGISTHSLAARSAIQRLQVHAAKQASGIQLRWFSALSSDLEALYVPVAGGDLLWVAERSVTPVDNGRNADRFWIEHPEQEPFDYKDDDPAGGLARFEQLLVETQACVVPEMRWLVATHEGLFPYVRDAVLNRLILVHQGPSQKAGKTSGAQRFTILHGLGEVKGDYTVASLGNMRDPGLLVMDNKEQANFNQPLIDYVLFLATGAQRARSSVDGNLRRSATRPVAVVTSIEGLAFKEELKRRCLEVEYLITGKPLGRGTIEAEIKDHRDEINSALLQVLQKYLTVRRKKRWTPTPVPEFQEHFRALADLLRAYGAVAGKSPGWSEDVIQVWAKTITSADRDGADELEPLLLEVLDSSNWNGTVHNSVTFGKLQGTLYVTEASPLLRMLEKVKPHGRMLPKNAQGLSRRLKSSSYSRIVVVDDEKAPNLTQLKRTSKRRPLGLFLEDDA